MLQKPAFQQNGLIREKRENAVKPKDNDHFLKSSPREAGPTLLLVMWTENAAKSMAFEAKSDPGGSEIELQNRAQMGPAWGPGGPFSLPGGVQTEL